MHSLERELHSIADAEQAVRAEVSLALSHESTAVFCVYEELRIAIYVAVALLTTGVGLLLKAQQERIGPVAILTGLALASAACYATALRTRWRGEERSLGGDYLLLLGALLLSAAVGYSQFALHWLGDAAPYLLLMLCALHALSAYLFGSRLVLSAAVASLAGFLGAQSHLGVALLDGTQATPWALRSLVCAAWLAIWRYLDGRLRGPDGFAALLEHCAVNFALGGAVGLLLQPRLRLAAALLLAALATAVVRRAVRTRMESYLLYGVGYAALGACVLEAVLLGEPVLIALTLLATIIGACLLLWRLHAGLGARA